MARLVRSGGHGLALHVQVLFAELPVASQTTRVISLVSQHASLAPAAQHVVHCTLEVLVKTREEGVVEEEAASGDRKLVGGGTSDLRVPCRGCRVRLSRVLTAGLGGNTGGSGGGGALTTPRLSCGSLVFATGGGLSFQVGSKLTILRLPCGLGGDCGLGAA